MKKVLLTMFCTIIFITNLFAAQADTVKVKNISAVPIIDAVGDDECWVNTEWQSIDQVWMTYGEIIPAADFTGKYKVVWSKETNLLYFLVDVTDDVFVDGWPGVDGDYFGFDIVEIFIDADKSGGLHVFDGTGNTGNDWGTNGENAFSYHINIDLPEDGGVSTSCVVNDMAGTDWSDVWNPNFADHFPEIALRESDGKYFWEFSLKVYGDSYDFDNPEASRVMMQTSDIMGFTMAYCDNDGADEDPKTRDNFFGSVWVPEAKYNDHWMDADGYGTFLLVDDVTEVSENPIIYNFDLMQNYPNPFNPTTQIDYSITDNGFVKLKIFDVLGNEVAALVNEMKNNGNHSVNFDAENLSSGTYFYSLQVNGKTITKKLMLVK
ncbi:MAG: T9SS type A sorting domain-containing protein [Melioribacteraceae bacterium]|nr:T9SS type A sorting domain-containing protein [Melioribacteraceae bacterium]